MSAQQTGLDLETRLIERTMAQREEMLTKADAEAKAMIDAAQGEAQRISSETERQVLNIVASVLRGVRDRIVGGVELESRKRLMLVREEAFSQIYADAQNKLGELTEDKKAYHDTLVKLTAEAIKAIGGEEFTVSASDRDLTDLKKNLKKLEADVHKATEVKATLHLNNTPIATSGGVIVSNTEGTKVYYNTIEGRLTAVKAKIDIKLAKLLEEA
jgi:vacuolar-type H+-ATPase subunit E/Vma4